MELQDILQIAQLPAMGVFALLVFRQMQTTEKTLDRLLTIVEHQERRLERIETQVRNVSSDV